MSEPCITVVKKDGTTEVKYVPLRQLPLPWESEFFSEELNRFLRPLQAEEFCEGKLQEFFTPEELEEDYQAYRDAVNRKNPESPDDVSPNDLLERFMREDFEDV